MHTSRLDRRIEIWTATETRTDSGGYETGWALGAEVWANVDFPKTGNTEGYQADAQVSVTRMVATIRRMEVDAKQKIRYNGQDFDILSVGEGAREWTIITCERRGDA